MQELLKPVDPGVTVVLDLIPTLSSAYDGAKRYEQDGVEAVFLCAEDSRIVNRGEKNPFGVLGVSYDINGYRHVYIGLQPLSLYKMRQPCWRRWHLI